MYEEIFEYLPDAILIVGRDGRILHANARAGQLFGFERAELLDLEVEALLPERFRSGHSQNRKAYFNQPHIRPMGTGLELYGRRGDGSEFPVDVTLGPLGEKHRAVVCAVRDITEQRQLIQALTAKNSELRSMTQQLWQTAKLATMGELSASIAHELNNPLGTISLRVEALLGQLAQDDPKYRALEVVAQETERMGNLVANLLLFSRRQTLIASTLTVQDELDGTIELIQYHLRNRQIDVVRKYADTLPLVQADRQGLRQVFLNVLTNAADAMPDGGVLTISVAPVNDEVHIEIADTGCGIASEDLHHVLDSFFTTKPEGAGTGLGLAICRRIIQEHHGAFDISSPGVGQGATVHIHLPGNGEVHGHACKQT